MVTIINQLEEYIQSIFANREDSYKDTIVKQKYKTIPQGYYPKVIIEEIENSEVSGRSTTQGERSTMLGYQITVYCRDTEEHEAIDAVRFILQLIDEALQPPNYNMQRIGSPAIIPFISDETVMTGALRYTCVYDYETNLLYRN
jgi:hypothetical protein